MPLLHEVDCRFVLFSNRNQNALATSSSPILISAIALSRTLFHCPSQRGRGTDRASDCDDHGQSLLARCVVVLAFSSPCFQSGSVFASNEVGPAAVRDQANDKDCFHCNERRRLLSLQRRTMIAFIATNDDDCFHCDEWQRLFSLRRTTTIVFIATEIKARKGWRVIFIHARDCCQRISFK